MSEGVKPQGFFLMVPFTTDFHNELRYSHWFYFKEYKCIVYHETNTVSFFNKAYTRKTKDFVFHVAKPVTEGNIRLSAVMRIFKINM